MKSKLTRLLAVAAAGVSFGLTAPAQATDLNYNYIEGGYVFSADVSGVDGDGFRLRGSVEVAPNILVLGELVNLGFDNGGDIDILLGGAGYLVRYNQTFDLLGTFQLGKVDVNGPGGSADESGFRLGLGGRARIAPNAHGFGRFVLEDFGGSDSYLEIGALYDVTPQFSVGGSLQFGGDVDMMTINGRFSF